MEDFTTYTKTFAVIKFKRYSFVTKTLGICEITKIKILLQKNISGQYQCIIRLKIFEDTMQIKVVYL